MSSPTRRDALVVIAAAAATPNLPAQEHQHDASAPPPATEPYKYRALSPAEVESVSKLVDIIIPRTDTPGATDAGVPEFIDRRAAANQYLAVRFRTSLAELDQLARKRFSKPFVQLTPEQGVELLTPVSTATQTQLGLFFRTVKEMTIDGYYSSYAGLVQELGWHGNTYLTEFKGCTHPEHQI